MLNDRENILSALREKPLKLYEIMKRANVVNAEACQSLLLKMRDGPYRSISAAQWCRPKLGTGALEYGEYQAALPLLMCIITEPREAQSDARVGRVAQ